MPIWSDPSTSKFYVTVGTSAADFITNGTNDDVEIQAAIDQVGRAGGGTVLLRTGTYTLNTTVNVLYSNVRITGEGWSAIVTLADNIAATVGSLAPVFRVGDGGTTTVSNIVFDNFQISGNKSNQTVGTYGIYMNKLVHDSAVHDMYIHDLRGKMIYNDGLLGNRNMRNQIKNNLLIDCSTGNNADDYDCIDNQNNDLTQVIGNICITPGDDGIDMGTGDHCKIIGNTVFGNSTATGIGSGIETDTCSNLVIADNNIYKATDYAIRCESQTAVQITGNNIYLAQMIGIELIAAKNCSVECNTIRRSSQSSNGAFSAIKLNTTGGVHSTNNKIAHNMIMEDGSNKAKYGIEEVDSNQNNNIITDNTLSGTFGTAPVLRNGSNSTFRRNEGSNGEGYYSPGNITGSVTFDRVNGESQTYTMTGNVTATYSNGVQPGDILRQTFIQDGTGSRTLTFPSNFKKAGGSLTLSTGASAVDTITAMWDGTNWREIGRVLNQS